MLRTLLVLVEYAAYLASALSLALWAWSIDRVTELVWPTAESAVYVTRVSDGQLYVASYENHHSYIVPHVRNEYFGGRAGRAATRVGGWPQNSGFSFKRSGTGTFFATVPLWSTTTLGVLTIVAARLLRRRIERRVTWGKCPACGYDLRATPRRCPEMFSLL